MIVQYKPNENDKSIIDDITNTIKESLDEWYGRGSKLDSDSPEIRSYRNSFILRYPLTKSDTQKRTILVKIRRNPKMDSFALAINADIHQNIPTEFRSLDFVYSRLAHMPENFGAIRPLLYIEKYFAIVMEEYPSRTLRQILIDHRSSKNEQSLSRLRDAARKTGRWLHYFHHHIHTPSEKHYSTSDILLEVQSYGERLQSFSNGRVRAQSLVDAFSSKLENIHIDRVTFSQSHADMTCDNVLYSDDKRVCIIDIKTRLAPIYSDLGLILIHPETSKPQIFSGGTYYPEDILREYRSEITSGYFDEDPSDEVLVRIYSAIKVMDKWLMYEELMSRYKGVKYLLSFPVGPFVTGYFQNLLKKHLKYIETPQHGPKFGMAKTADRSA
jgi:thiamine kinase-like enzyme